MTYAWVWPFLIGLFVGANVGLVLLSMLVAARKADDEAKLARLYVERSRLNQQLARERHAHGEAIALHSAKAAAWERRYIDCAGSDL